MAGLGLEKDQSRHQDASLPTPLRRRASSPASTLHARGAASAKGVAGKLAEPKPAAEAPKQGRRSNVLKCVGGIVLMVLGMLALLLQVVPPPRAKDGTVKINVRQMLKSGPPLLERVATALSCPGPRADIVDILAGAPYEFFRRNVVADGTDVAQQYQAAFESLPKLVARATREQSATGPTRAETELQDTVVQLASTGAGWPAALRQRLLVALDGPCKVACTPGDASNAPLPLEVDPAFTSAGTVSANSGWLHRTLLNLGAATGIPLFRRRADMYKSRPASVIVSSAPITPRDCLALRGNASVALRIAGAVGSADIRQIVIEQLPHWVAPKLWTLPGRFNVWGEPAVTAGGAANPYTVHLGSFEYVAAAPAPQAFELPPSVPLRGIRLAFQEPAAGGDESFFCIYRLRAFDAKPPSCTEGTSNAPVRLVVPV